jgi:hypothetical protein
MTAFWGYKHMTVIPPPSFPFLPSLPSFLPSFLPHSVFISFLSLPQHTSRVRMSLGYLEIPLGWVYLTLH